MKVKMLTLSSGPSGTRQVGDVVEVSADEGKQLIDGRFAETVKDDAAADAGSAVVERKPATKKKPADAGDGAGA